MKFIILFTLVIVVGLAASGSAFADTQAYNSKRTQNVSHKTSSISSGGQFTGAYLHSKNGSGNTGPTRLEGGKTDPRPICCHQDSISPKGCARHCGVS